MDTKRFAEEIREHAFHASGEVHRNDNVSPVRQSGKAYYVDISSATEVPDPTGQRSGKGQLFTRVTVTTEWVPNGEG